MADDRRARKRAFSRVFGGIQEFAWYEGPDRRGTVSRSQEDRSNGPRRDRDRRQRRGIGGGGRRKAGWPRA